MANWLRVGDPAILVRVRQNRRARRFVLRVSGFDGAPVLTMPEVASVAEARRFADEHEHWLREKMTSRPRAALLDEGMLLPVEGREFRLALGRGVALDGAGARLVLPGPPARLPAQAAGFLRALARETCARAVARHAAALGRRHGRITLRDTRSRWGSCTSRGDLMFSWRLAMAPREVLDYVVAHEVAHLAEMNHSPRFWAVVARLRPDYASARAWLRQHGAGLHRYDFRAASANPA